MDIALCAGSIPYCRMGLALPKKLGWGLRGLKGKEEVDRERFREPCASLMAWGPLVAGGTGTGPGSAALRHRLHPSACSVAGRALLGHAWGPKGYQGSTRLIWSMEAELVSPFSVFQIPKDWSHTNRVSASGNHSFNPSSEHQQLKSPKRRDCNGHERERVKSLKEGNERSPLLTCVLSLPVKSRKKGELRITCVPIKQPVANTT